ncbi:hypothetical protein C882_0420 [Caenispirillum salinarum AK4]|uniref:Rv0623 family protein transcription factor n=1 Tax=Caenispirillum salinarum AK4 TaxID=1238182 RepID=K9GWH6_9PROT|nr:type II toxin-antitoxin system VapB family antitoxin [Caenispirillum salinarum]EKV29597.1 hypothetical protein C882_0420 [Caenispirillum salinarum AK4]
MGFQSDNARIREKIERLARLKGLDEESALEDALDAQLSVRRRKENTPEARRARLEKIVEEINAIGPLPPDQQFDAVEWDDLGLPK